MKKLYSVVAMLLLMASAALAQVQAGLGALAGTVQDKTKAAIPGATVTLSNPGIGYKKTVTANGAGGYSFSPLTVAGGYSLTITAPGFATEVISDLTTSVGTVINQNATLAVGKSDVTVEVQGTNEEQVQTDTSSLSQVVDKTVWENSPLETRSQNQFVGLTIGAAGSGGTGRGYAINGARSGTGNFLVDGVDNNDQGLGGGAAGGAVTTISPDAIQEFRVISSTPPAEYGRAGGFATDTVLKSGTKTWHGSAFEYNRIQAITANNWFSDQGGLRDHLVRNQFGGSLGGRIYKDKTFFYATAEFQRKRQSTPGAGIITTTSDFINFVKSGAYEKFNEGLTQQNAAIGQIGICPYNGVTTCPGYLARAATLGATFSTLFAATPQSFPLATATIAGANIAEGLYSGGTVFPVNIYGQTTTTNLSPLNENRGSIKLDHTLTSKDQLSFTYLVDLNNENYNNGGSDSLPGLPLQAVGGAQLFGASWTHTFTPTLINVFKGSYLRHVNNLNVPGPVAPSTYAADSLYTGFGASSGEPQLFTENQFGYEDSITKTIGRHTAKAGFSFKRTRNGSSFYNDVNGSVIPWSVEGLLTDGTADADLDGTGIQPALPFSYGVGGLYEVSASLNPVTKLAPDPYRGYRANEFAAYIQDDFKATARLTLNYGLRWDYFGPPHNFKAGVDSNVFFGAFGLPAASTNPFVPQVPLAGAEQGASFQLIGTNGHNALWNKDTNNIGPRLGFAYDTFGTGKLVIRGGFGIGYDRLYNNVFENIRFNGPGFVDNTFGYGASNGTTVTEKVRADVEKLPFTANADLAAAGAGPVPRHVDERLVTAYYEQAHLGVESALPKGFILEANYVGTWGRKLVGIMNINTFDGRTACPTVTKAYAVTSPCYGLTATHLGFSSARLTSAFGNDNFRTNLFNSNYNAGQVSLRKGFSNGLQMTANYTFSKALDEVSDVFTIKSGATGITSPYHPSYDYGPADFDVKHNFIFTANYVSHSSTHKYLLAGWGISPILSLSAGTPIDLIDGSSSYSPNKDGSFGVQRAVYIGPGSIKNAINHGVSPAGLTKNYLNPAYFTGTTYTVGTASVHNASYSCPTTVAFCDAPMGRNSLTGPRNENLDMSISKKTTIYSHYSLTVQAAFFDVLNHPEFGNPVANVHSGTFGQSTSATNRVGQLSGRIDF